MLCLVPLINFIGSEINQQVSLNLTEDHCTVLEMCRYQCHIQREQIKMSLLKILCGCSGIPKGSLFVRVSFIQHELLGMVSCWPGCFISIYFFSFLFLFLFVSVDLFQHLLMNIP